MDNPFSFFSYDSKFSKCVIYLSNMVVLNMLYLICCLPLFTIGAAQAGMLSAARVMQNPENDESCFKAYFRGFRSGFGRITILWILFSLLIVVAALGLLISTMYYEKYVGNGLTVVSGIALAVCAVIQSMAVIVHTHFGCTVRQLLANAFIVSVRYLFRAVGAAILIWLPVLIAFWNVTEFLRIMPLWIFGYYGLAFQVLAKLIRTPFRRIAENARITTE